MDNQISNGQCEKMELYFHCINLTNRDVLSKSDPFIEVYLQTRNHKGYLVGRTEVIKDNLNPTFKKPVTIDYFFETQQTLTIHCLDHDEGGSHDDLGTATCTVSQILMAPIDGLTLSLNSSSKKASKVKISYQKIGQTNKTYGFKVRCTKVKDIEFFSKSDPFLRIFRPAQVYEAQVNPSQIPDSGWVQVHETEQYMDNLNPVFRPFNINSAALNRGNPNMLNRWEIWDWESDGKHRVISSIVTSMSAILGGQRMIDTKDKKGKFGGNILFDDIKVMIMHPISSYIKMGMRLAMAVGVDFTGSNGIASSPSSLHFIGYGQNLNHYQQAIMEVGIVMMDYSDDKMIPAYGFGAKLPGTRTVNFCFPLNGNPQMPQVQSYQGLLQAYNKIVSTLEFAGPTNFRPLIESCRLGVEQGFAINKLVYSTLLIITDGLISDFHETVECIVKCSRLPMSIIIVGVGNEDFTQMELLDSDDKLLTDRYGNACLRDCVQFVPFRDFAVDPVRLAECVLREIPGQINYFYNAIGLVPSE